MSVIEKFHLDEFANEIEKTLDENETVSSIVGSNCKLNLVVRAEDDDMFSLHLDIESSADELDEDDAEAIADQVTENFSELVANSLDEENASYLEGQHVGTSILLNGVQIY